MSKNKSSVKKSSVQFLLISFTLLLAGILVLVLSPSAVKLTESKISYSGNEAQQLPQIIDNKVLGEEAPTKVEVIAGSIPAPHFSSGAVYAIDLDLGYEFYSKNANNKMAPASTTKIMTALVAAEHFKTGDILTVPAQALVGGSTMGLGVGEQLTFRSLLYGMLLNSGNDAAYTIAYNYPGGYEAFIARMNSKALEMGLKNSHFMNPAGFDNPEHYSSAYDLAQIAREAIKNPQLAKVFQTPDANISTIDKSKVFLLKNLNKLLNIDGVIGIKTGTTELAGENFVGLVDKNGHRLLTVVLKSDDRFGETKNLIDWIYSNFIWKTAS